MRILSLLISRQSFSTEKSKSPCFTLKIPLFNILLQDNRKKQYQMVIFYKA